jgi:Pyruvate/2-oxoacid:ferredoxin oxidoreductase gamma subunit
MTQQFDNGRLTEADTEIAHEDALVFDLGALTIGWKPSGLALKRASKQGVEAGEILDTLRGNADAALLREVLEETGKEDLGQLEEEDIEALPEAQREALGDLLGGSLASQVEMVATLVWVGVLHFEPNAKQEAILSVLDPAAIEELPIDAMFERIFPALSEVEVGGDGEGK